MADIRDKIERTLSLIYRVDLSGVVAAEVARHFDAQYNTDLILE